MKKPFTLIPGMQAPSDRRVLKQLMLPMIAGIAATKEGMLDFVHRAGLEAFEQLLREDAERIAGPKGKKNSSRRYNHWGTTRAEVTLGGRKVGVKKARVRSKNSREVMLEAWRELASVDPLPERVVEQVLLGVSTRGYERSLDPMPKEVKTRGTSKSTASRHLVAETQKKMRDYLSRRIDELDLWALFLDGIEVDEYTVIVALGVTRDGKKVPLDARIGSTENSTVCAALLNNLVERGLGLDHSLLVVIDGGKGLRKAVNQVLDGRAVVQRCQRHKMENVLGHLADSKKPYVIRQMRAAYKCDKAERARRTLRQLVAWLEHNGDVDAAASLREGMEETLTVHKLGLPRNLRRSFSTTNPIESLNSTIRRVTRNVKRWRGGKMVKRWVALSIAEAEKKFRRLKGHRDMPVLVRALEEKSVQLDGEEAAA